MIKKTVLFLSLIFTALYILGAACPLIAFAEEYPVAVCGKAVNSENASDVLGDSKVRYDEKTATLTLENAALEGGIVFSGGLATINLIGVNTINSTSSAVTAPGGLNVTGPGSLEAEAGEYGIYASELLVFAQTGLVTLRSKTAGVYGEDAEIKVNSGRLNAYGEDDGSYGVYCKNGSYEQTLGNVTASGKKAAVMVVSESAGELVSIGEMIKIAFGGRVAKGDENGVYWATFLDSGGAGKPSPDDASKKVSLVKLCAITQEGEHFTLCDKNKNELPQTVAPGEMLMFCVFIDTGYEAGENFAVKVNGKTLTASAGLYTTAEIYDDITITVEGVRKQKSPGSSADSLSSFGMTEILAIAFVVCLVAVIAYIAYTTGKENKRKAEKKAKIKNKHK